MTVRRRGQPAAPRMIPAKIMVPGPSNAVPRPRLFARLDAAREQRIVWVCGPPGAGKTCLVASYLESRRLRALWYHADARDADPANLFHYFSVAAALMAR